jgi:hypothetical protein
VWYRDRSRRLALLTCLLAAWAGAAAGEESPRGGEALAALPVQAVWTDVPVRDWATRLTTAGSATGAVVVVDLRFDPAATVSCDCRGEPLGDVAERVARSLNAGVDVLESSIRIVPQDHAGIAARAEIARRRELDRLQAARRQPLARRAAWRWPDGATPRGLIASEAQAASIEIANLDAVPHDHLPALSLPPLSLAERLDLLLASYDLRVQWSDAGGRIVPLETGIEGVTLPVTRRPRPAPAVAPPAGAQRFTLRLAAPFEQAISSLAPRLGLDAQIDRDSLAARGIQPSEIVRVEVRDATRDELLDALCAPLQLRWQIEGSRLTIDAPQLPAGP